MRKSTWKHTHLRGFDSKNCVYEKRPWNRDRNIKWPVQLRASLLSAVENISGKQWSSFRRGPNKRNILISALAGSSGRCYSNAWWLTLSSTTTLRWRMKEFARKTTGLVLLSFPRGREKFSSAKGMGDRPVYCIWALSSIACDWILAKMSVWV